ncbi:MAG: hypothetical protein IRZ03_17610, partial [Acidobacterium ailaaui]|nr:hypothetical protein [Pseudacidobacterium ailaaui]
MESVKYILGLPEFIPEIGNVYPIQMYHYDEFMDVANLISLDYDHFIDAKKYQDKIDSGEIKLFDFIYQIVILEEQLFPKLVRLFELCTRSEVELD